MTEDTPAVCDCITQRAFCVLVLFPIDRVIWTKPLIH